ncbi:elongation factor Ts [[Clostridium] spiroforme]|nr:elongation factor Ts [Thomasclavelia spiroformis]MBM6880410.1 elongation factor Ts [Thomasclavelia spiroformis]
MAISAKLVKELREKTGAGMMDCKKALEACDGDIEKSFDWLREKGIAKAAKKADRIAAEGLAAFTVNGNTAAIVEVNSETDFVAKNAEFQELVKTICDVVAQNKPADLEAALKIEVNGKPLETVIAEASGKIGEKLSFRRFEIFTKEDNEVFGAYSHMGGKMVSIVKLSDADEEKAKDIAMHVAAINPQFISQDEIPQEVKDREDAVQSEIMANDEKLKNKPEKVLEGIKRGKLNKVFSEMCLLDQEFIKTPKETVAKYLGKSKVLSMARFQVGEGMEKREENFAEEVAAQMSK